MIQLVNLIDEHPDAIAYDLRAWSGARLRDFPSAAVTWHDLSVLIRVSSGTPDTALFRALNPDTPDRYSRDMLMLDLTRHVLHRHDLAAWARGGGKGITPSAVRFPWEKPERTEDAENVEHRTFDAMGLDEAVERLGGDPRMAAAFKRAQLTAVA